MSKDSTIIQLSLLICLSMYGCTSSKELVLDAVWEQDQFESRKFRKIAVFGLTDSTRANIRFEENAVRNFKSKGIRAIAGHEVYNIALEGPIDPDHLKRYLFSLGFDGILTTALIDNISTDNEDISDDELQQYTEGIYKFGQYFQIRYEESQKPSHDIYGVLEANFYYIMDYNEFDGSGLVWISHYQIDPEYRATFEVSEYSKRIVNSLFEDQVILRK
ncbi:MULTISPECIES: hypothetical protein [Reichenbachiella]|uniref:hypothetical protein n=1 Tax=Reichenbachiella TaxID=156993 RepID=UPI0011C3485B|nr:MULTISPECIES: hypothetical protein [Reichenbachiella]MBU2914584.1 hypothetical protein [Reichenbachiella agariperforans]